MSIQWIPRGEPHLKSERDGYKPGSCGKNQRPNAKQWLKENVGDTCVFCGATELIEYDHINPGLKKHVSIHNCLARAQEEGPNLRPLCYNCHKEHSILQRRAAYKLFINLPLHEQERLINEIKNTP